MEASTLDSLRSHFHPIAHVVQLLGCVLIVVGILRFVRAPTIATRVSGRGMWVQSSAGSASDTGAVDFERLTRVRLPAADRPDTVSSSERFTHGLSNFYRMRAGLTALAGVVLVVITFVAW